MSKSRKSWLLCGPFRRRALAELPDCEPKSTKNHQRDRHVSTDRTSKMAHDVSVDRDAFGTEVIGDSKIRSNNDAANHHQTLDNRYKKTDEDELPIPVESMGWR